VTIALLAVVILLALSLTGLGATHLRFRRKPAARLPATGCRRILFPFIANALSSRALDAALRLAGAEDATLVPVFLARVSLQLPLDTPLPRQSNIAIPLQEAIERRAAKFGITVDARIERGRTYRHALRQTMNHERFDRIVIAAAAHNSPGFGPEDIAWILENAPGEIIILRPDHEEVLTAPRKMLLKPTRRGRRASSRVVRTRSVG
jgi:nucleotide-binding universal stress UspA family protein